MVQIFVTGATGYIGGDALHEIAKAHPNVKIAALVRDAAKGSKVLQQHPNVEIIHGSLDDSDIIQQESAKADIVINWADADHAGTAAAIIKGLAQHPAEQPVYFIHTSGTGVLMVDDFINKRPFGSASEKVFDDIADIKEITSFPDAAPHRPVDKIVLAAGREHPQIKSAIVCPPAIYGEGRGALNQRSIQIPVLANETLKRGEGITIGEGQARWSGVNVQDLSKLYLLLVDQALKRRDSEAKFWGSEAYYFAENEQFNWADISQHIADIALKQGWIKSDNVRSLSKEEAEKILAFAPYMWGVNSRSRASRARKLLGWKPVAPKVREITLRALQIEKDALDKTA